MLEFCRPIKQGVKVVLYIESVGLGVSHSSAFLDHPMFGQAIDRCLNGLVVELGGPGQHGNGLFHVAHDSRLIEDSRYRASEQ